MAPQSSTWRSLTSADRTAEETRPMPAAATSEANRSLPGCAAHPFVRGGALPRAGCTWRCPCRDRGTGVYVKVPSPRPGGTWRPVCREPWQLRRVRVQGRVRVQENGGGACKRVQPTVPGTIPPGTAGQRLRWDTYVTGGPGTAMRDAIKAGVDYSQGRLLIYPRGSRRPMNLPRLAAMHRRSRTAGAVGVAARPKKPATSGPSSVSSVSVNKGRGRGP